MSHKRGQWGSRFGFILAAIGSAVGLGNIWRFPYTVASNGGGAFLIPYFVALITAGIPLLILEFALGHRMKTSAPGIFGRLNRKWQKLGWWQTAIAFAIACYYIVIVGWSINYVIFSANLSWGADTANFFDSYIGLSDSPLNLGGFRLNIFIPLLVAWLFNFIVLALGVKGGIEKASKVVMPLLIVSTIVIAVRGLTLPGALQGLDYMFKPDFSKIMDGRVWVAAYGQIFYSLSICFGIMLAYSSYLPKDSDIVNNAFITAFGNCSYSILAGISVFSVLGYMAQSQGKEVADVASAGVGLVFKVFPQAINDLPGFGNIFGIVFFGCLVFAGISSSMSILETVLAAISDKFNISRIKSLAICCLVGFSISIIYATGAGLYILDIVDHFINNYCIAIAGFIEIILLGWFFNLESVRKYVNPRSDFTVGKWWNFCIKIVTPLILGTMIILKIIEDITMPYEGYDVIPLLIYGGGIIVITVVLALLFNNLKGSDHFNKLLDKEVKHHEF